MNSWVVFSIIVAFGFALWRFELHLAKKDAEEQARLRKHAQDAAAKAKAEIPRRIIKHRPRHDA